MSKHQNKMLSKKQKIIKISLLVIFAITFFIFEKVNAQFVNNANNPSLSIDHTADKSIILNIHKSGGKYLLQGAIKLVDGAKSDYVDSYQIYKGKAYDGRVVSFSGKPLGYFPANDMAIVICRDNFNPNAQDRGGCEELSEGDIQLRIPYFTNGRYVDFYNKNSEKILTVDISSVAVCNENSVCENSENINNCPSDCQKNESAINTNQNQNNKPPDISPTDNQTDQEQQKNNAAPYIIIAVLVIFVGTIIFFWIKRKRNDQSDLNSY